MEKPDSKKRRRNVAHDLGCEDADEDFPTGERCRKPGGKGGNSAEISDENKKCEKRGEQGIIDLCQHFLSAIHAPKRTRTKTAG